MNVSIKKTYAAILNKQNSKLILSEIKLPSNLEHGQVLVKMIYSGICGSQLGEIMGKKGPDKFLPHLLGHEAIAQVINIGKKVYKVKKGDYVLLHWMKSKGLDAKLPSYKWKRKKLNAGNITTFSRHSIVSQTRLTKINKKNVNPITCLIGCSASTAICSVNMLNNIDPNSKVAIIGCGPIGVLISKYLNYKKIFNIHAFDIDKKKLSFAFNNGAKKIFWTKKKIFNSYIANNYDYIFECTGNAKIISKSFENLTDEGTLVLIGVPDYKQKAKFDTLKINLGRKIVGSKGGNFNPDKDFSKILDILRDKKFILKTFKLELFSFEDINKVIDKMKNNKIIGKAIIQF